jgi:hypothetical protein
MDVAPRVFLLGVIDEVMRIALERPIAAGGVRIKPTARLDGEVRGLLASLPPTISRIPLNIKRLTHFMRYDVVM